MMTETSPTGQQYDAADRLLRERMMQDADAQLALLRCWITDERKRRQRERYAAEWRAALASYDQWLTITEPRACPSPQLTPPSRRRRWFTRTTA